MNFGIISDTHNFLDPQVGRIFAGVDHIFHGGDIGSRAIIDGLAAIAPVTAVSGNTDDPGQGYKRTAVTKLAGRTFMVHHIVNPDYLTGTLAEEIQALAPDVVIYGHTHKHSERWIGSTLFLNPGYAGKQRFSHPRGVAVLHCTTKSLRVEFVPL